MKANHLLLIVVAVALGACSSSKKASISGIEGSWNIVKVEGKQISGDPYIGFNTVAGRIYGNAGCNNLIGSFDTDAPAGTLSLGNLGSTLMMCPDMSTEDTVLAALAKVTSFKKNGEGYALLDGDGATVAELLPRCKEMKAGKLDGEWTIVRINGDTLSGNTGQTPVITFDAGKRRISCSGICNIINGSYKTDGKSITFSQMISTMMACPDMETEARLTEALDRTAKFGEIPGGNLGLFDDNDNLLIELSRK